MTPIVAIALLAPLLAAASAPAARADPPAIAGEAAPHRVAFATDPIGLLAGTYALSATYAVSRRVALRANAQYASELPGLADSRTWQASISAPIYFDRAFHGPFLEPGLVVADRVMGYDIVPAAGDAMDPSYVALRFHTVGPHVFVGWQWTFRSGLHATYAIGASRNLTAGSATWVPIAESYLRVGFAL